MVASDRISIYDVVMPTPITDKGKVLNRISEFWFELTGDIVPNHFISADVPEDVAERAMRVRRLEMYPVECVVRGYLSGSGWKEYKNGGAVCGIELPAELLESDKLPEPIFTPATKAEIGDHDENVDFDRAAEIVGDRALMEELRRISIEVYQRGAEHAAERGIILADTKFEFGRHAGAEIVLADEVLTPDSSRFWPADRYEPGKTQPSFDKQYVRDWATESGWDKTPPAPEIPPDVVEQTRAKYVEAYERVTELASSAEGAGLDPPEGGDPRPPGQGGRASAAGARLRGDRACPRRPHGRARRRGPGAAGRALREAARQPADRGLRDRAARRRCLMRWGVLQFPGSCDERDALAACERTGAEARLVWHEERDLDGIDAVVVPGGFSYGDYLRAGAIARFSPAMEAVSEFAAAGGPVLGICNGFQVLCEAGLLPGALLLNESLRFTCRQLDLIEVPTGDLNAPEAHTSRQSYLVDPGQARGRAVLRAGWRCSTSSRRRGRSLTATRRGRTRTGRPVISRGCATRRATWSG